MEDVEGDVDDKGEEDDRRRQAMPPVVCAEPVLYVEALAARTVEAHQVDLQSSQHLQLTSMLLFS